MRTNRDSNPFSLTDPTYSGGKKRFSRQSFSTKAKRSYSIDIFHSTKRSSHESLGLLINHRMIVIWLMLLFFGIFIFFRILI